MQEIFKWDFSTCTIFYILGYLIQKPNVPKKFRKVSETFSEGQKQLSGLAVKKKFRGIHRRTLVMEFFDRGFSSAASSKKNSAKVVSLIIFTKFFKTPSLSINWKLLFPRGPVKSLSTSRHIFFTERRQKYSYNPLVELYMKLFCMHKFFLHIFCSRVHLHFRSSVLTSSRKTLVFWKKRNAIITSEWKFMWKRIQFYVKIIWILYKRKSFPERATMHYYARVVLQFILQVLFYL